MVHWLHYFESEVRLNIMVAGICGRDCSLLVDRKELGTKYNLQTQTPTDLLPPGRPYLLNFHHLPK
jgi:hypothetical protein